MGHALPLSSLLLLLLVLSTPTCSTSSTANATSSIATAATAHSCAEPYCLRFLSPTSGEQLVAGMPIALLVELTTRPLRFAHVAAMTRQPPALELCFGLRRAVDGAFRVDLEKDVLRCDPVTGWGVGSGDTDDEGTSREQYNATLAAPADEDFGPHAVWAILRHRGGGAGVGGGSSGGRVVGRTPLVARFDVIPRVFEPSYEWAPVLPGQAAPQGLEVRMDLGGGEEGGGADGAGESESGSESESSVAGAGKGGKTARIPPSWRLQVWLEGAPTSSSASSNTTSGKKGAGGRFFRRDVTAATSVADIVADAAALLRAPADCVSAAWLDRSAIAEDAKTTAAAAKAAKAATGSGSGDGDAPQQPRPRPIAPGATAEEARLFQHRENLRFIVDDECSHHVHAKQQ